MIDKIKIWVIVLVGCILVSSAGSAQEIPLQNLTMHLPINRQTFSEKLLSGAISEIEVDHLIVVGPFVYTETMKEEYDNIYIFIKGKGHLEVADQSYKIEPETILLPVPLGNISVEVSGGDTLHQVRIRKKLSDQDIEDIKNFPPENRKNIYFKKISDCIPYTEKIKSPKTVSRTILPKDYVSRVAMGTVATTGPDKVDPHEHPMLEQLFLSLSRNQVTLHADNLQTDFPEYTLLHIPLGSSHWVEAEDDKIMYYVWMDFFMDKKGEEWLKTHEEIKKK